MDDLIIGNLCPYWCTPPTGGGPIRVHNLNRELSDRYTIFQISIRPTLGHRANAIGRFFSAEIVRPSPRYSELQLFSPIILGISFLLYRLGFHSDLLLSPILEATHTTRIENFIRRASILQIEHPWLIDFALHIAQGRPIVFIAHNVESDLWSDPSGFASKILPFLRGGVARLERKAYQEASAVVTMSEHDAIRLKNFAGKLDKPLFIIPNGVNLETHRPASSSERIEARKRLGFDGRLILLFVGTNHYPNREALNFIRKWQSDPDLSKDLHFVVVGGVGTGFRSTPNLSVTGHVVDVIDYLRAADIGLNPLVGGSGTSLKIVEYLAHGLPTVTTRIGLRGTQIRNGEGVLVGGIEEFPSMILRLVSDKQLREEIGQRGRLVVEETYSWSKLAHSMSQVYGSVYP